MGFKATLISGLMVFLLVASVTGAAFSYEKVPEGHVGVEKEWGAVNGNTLDAGVSWVTPVQDSAQSVEIRPRTYTMSAEKGEGKKSEADAVSVKTVNGSSVAVDLTVRYRIKSENADQFVREWNNEQQMEQRLIRPTIRSTLRDEASSLQTTGEGSIYTREGRQALETTATAALKKEFEGQPVVLEAVQIRNIDLPQKIDRTLDEKEQAKQQVQVEKERVKQEEARAEQKRVEAEGRADVIRKEGAALRDNPIVLESDKIKAYDEGTVFVTDGGSDQIILDATNSTKDGN